MFFLVPGLAMFAGAINELFIRMGSPVVVLVIAIPVRIVTMAIGMAAVALVTSALVWKRWVAAGRWAPARSDASYTWRD